MSRLSHAGLRHPGEVALVLPLGLGLVEIRGIDKSSRPCRSRRSLRDGPSASAPRRATASARSALTHSSQRREMTSSANREFDQLSGSLVAERIRNIYEVQGHLS